MFSLVVMGVAAAVFVMYFRHDRAIRRKRRDELAERGESSDDSW